MTAAHRRERRLWLALCLALAAALIAVTTVRATSRTATQDQTPDGIQRPGMAGVDDSRSVQPSTWPQVPLHPVVLPSVAAIPAVVLPRAPRSVIEGVASWYCLPGRSRCTHGYPDGLYAAIRRDLLGHRGDRARVCRSDEPAVCVTIRAIDCNCGPTANLVDLYSTAFARLAPLGTGRIAVTLEWL